MIQLENIHKSFGNLEVLKGVSLSVAKGEVVSIVGASGAGKSTLLNIMGSLMEPSGGKVMIAGTDIFSLPDKSLAAFRNREIGFVFQFHHLLPEFTALENVMMPALIGGAKWGSREVEARARLLLEDLGVGERLQHKPGQLSGGEQQRVAIARALMNNPAVLLADEPSGNLDSRNKEELHKLFFMLREKYGQTIVIVTHEMELARMCDRCIEMKDGQILGHEGEPCLENCCIEMKDGQILGSGGGAVSGKCGFSAQHNSHTGCSCGEHSTHKTL